MKMKKTKVTSIILFLALVFSFGVPTYAATKDAIDAQSARAATQYIAVDATLHSGIPYYSSLGQCYSSDTYLYLSYVSPSIGITASTCDSAYNKISESYTANKGIDLKMENSMRYPGQYIRVKLVVTGVEEGISVLGKFYYNGL